MTALEVVESDYFDAVTYAQADIPPSPKKKTAEQKSSKMSDKMRTALNNQIQVYAATHGEPISQVTKKAVELIGKQIGEMDDNDGNTLLRMLRGIPDYAEA